MIFFRSKAFRLVTVITLFITCVFVVLCPKWWLNASESEFVSWYPNLGMLIYFYLNHILFFQILISLIITINWLVQNFLHFPILKSFYEKFRFFLEKDVLENSKFTIHLFFKTLSFVYLIAFSSLLWQLSMVSENGLISFKDFAHVIFREEGYYSIFNHPSIFWMNQSNWFIYSVLTINIFSSILNIIYRPRILSFLLMWFSYLSIVTFGRDLFQFPWDTYLLEIGFIAIFAIFFIQFRKRLPNIVRITFLVLFFRQWFSMSLTKLLYSDSSWYDLSFMNYFWINQPSPTPIAIYLFHLPLYIQNAITFFALLLELLIPLFMLFGRKGRYVSFFISLFVSIVLQVNGNFGFFNVLTITISFWCLDDYFFRKKKTLNGTINLFEKNSFVDKVLSGIVGTVLSVNLIYASFWLFDPTTQRHPANFLNYYIPDEKSFLALPFEIINNFRIVSPHGVFKGIPHERLHIKFFVFTKRQEWVEVKFKKGNDLLQFSFSAPIMYRLPFNFFYQSYGFSFNRYLKINENSNLLSTWVENLVQGIFNHNLEIEELVLVPNGEILKIKVVRYKVNFNRLNSVNFTMIDQVLFKKGENIKSPLFDLKFN